MGIQKESPVLVRIGSMHDAMIASKSGQQLVNSVLAEKLIKTEKATLIASGDRDANALSEFLKNDSFYTLNIYLGTLLIYGRDNSRLGSQVELDMSVDRGGEYSTIVNQISRAYVSIPKMFRNIKGGALVIDLTDKYGSQNTQLGIHKRTFSSKRDLVIELNPDRINVVPNFPRHNYYESSKYGRKYCYATEATKYVPFLTDSKRPGSDEVDAGRFDGSSWAGLMSLSGQLEGSFFSISSERHKEGIFTPYTTENAMAIMTDKGQTNVVAEATLKGSDKKSQDQPIKDDSDLPPIKVDLRIPRSRF